VVSALGAAVSPFSKIEAAAASNPPPRVPSPPAPAEVSSNFFTVSLRLGPLKSSILASPKITYASELGDLKTSGCEITNKIFLAFLTVTRMIPGTGLSPRLFYLLFLLCYLNSYAVFLFDFNFFL